MTETKIQKKMGRPKKEKKGRNVYVPAEILDPVVAMVNMFRQQQEQKKA
jgi:hypothetical protein